MFLKRLLVSQTSLARDWRFLLTLGLAIGIGLAVTNDLEPSLGRGIALVIGTVVSAGVSAIVALALYWPTRRRKADG